MDWIGVFVSQFCVVYYYLTFLWMDLILNETYINVLDIYIVLDVNDWICEMSRMWLDANWLVLCNWKNIIGKFLFICFQKISYFWPLQIIKKNFFKRFILFFASANSSGQTSFWHWHFTDTKAWQFFCHSKWPTQITYY